MDAKNPDAETTDDMRPFLIRYKDGRVVRLAASPFVPASEVPGEDGVATRDVVDEPYTGVSVHLFLSVAAHRRSNKKKLPLIVYYHGGGFCSGSAFSKFFHRPQPSVLVQGRLLCQWTTA
ncbi:unnamed protein product [Urochloa humidicola]